MAQAFLDRTTDCIRRQQKGKKIAPPRPPLSLSFTQFSRLKAAPTKKELISAWLFNSAAYNWAARKFSKVPAFFADGRNKTPPQPSGLRASGESMNHSPGPDRDGGFIRESRQRAYHSPRQSTYLQQCPHNPTSGLWPAEPDSNAKIFFTMGDPYRCRCRHPDPTLAQPPELPQAQSFQMIGYFRPRPAPASAFHWRQFR